MREPFQVALAKFLSGNLLHGRAKANPFSPSLSLDPSHFMVGAGSGAILSMLSFALCDSGDGILIPSPSYPGFGILEMNKMN